MLGRVFGALMTVTSSRHGASCASDAFQLSRLAQPTDGRARVAAPVVVQARARPSMQLLDGRLRAPEQLSLISAIDDVRAAHAGHEGVPGRGPLGEAHFAVGDVLVREGDESDLFYVIETGMAELPPGDRVLPGTARVLRQVTERACRCTARSQPVSPSTHAGSPLRKGHGHGSSACRGCIRRCQADDPRPDRMGEVPSQLPDGDVAPRDGTLPESALEGVGSARSASTCTCRSARSAAATATSTPTPPQELGDAPGASRATYAEAAIAELRLARRVLGDARRAGLHGVLRRGYADAAAARRDLAAIARGGRRRVRAGAGRRGDHRVQPRQRRRPTTWPGCARPASTGSPSGCSRRSPHVLATLDRTHDPARVPAVVEWARAAGFEQVSLDLIYGTPGESLDGLGDVASTRRSPAQPDHVSAYALIVEEGTALARRIKRGELPMPDDDDLADKYLAGRRAARPPPAWSGTRSRTGPATRRAAAGTTSSTGPAATGGASDPGAHSHVGGVRWWNVKHPAAYAERLAEGASPAHAREMLDERDPARGAGAARGAAARGAARSTSSTRRARRPCTPRRRAGC